MRQKKRGALRALPHLPRLPANHRLRTGEQKRNMKDYLTQIPQLADKKTQVQSGLVTFSCNRISFN